MRTGTSICSANSSSLGSRPRTSWSSIDTRRIFDILSTRCTGSRIVLDWLAKARLIDCLIHHDEYVESLPPFAGSNRSTPFINPMFPSLIRSSSGSPSPS